MSEKPDRASHDRRRRDARPDHRAISHASAHADPHAHVTHPIPQHPLIPKTPASLITTPDALADLITHVRSVGSFAYDSEFIGEMTYIPKLCLIQVATSDRVALIDALAGLDLAAFWNLIADPSVEKLVHCGQQDLEPVFRFTSSRPNRVFDTQIAAGFIGLAYPVGLSKLVRELTGARLGKGFTFTHWDHRPLTSVQLRYAADDVRYLPAVRFAIGQRLEPLGHAAWVAEECDSLCDPALYRLDPATDFARIRGSHTLSSAELAVLREIVSWRENAALQADTPPRSYLRDDVLIHLARRPPKALADLAKTRGLPRPVELAEGPNILAAVHKGLTVPQADCPPVQQIEESPADRFAIDSLWAAVQAWCAGQSVDPALVSSRQEIARLHRDVLPAGAPNPDTRLMRGWRAELVGKLLLDFLHGAASFHISCPDGALRSRRVPPSA